MGRANRPTPAFLMALVALWASPGRCADATAADGTAAPTVGDFSFIDEIRGGGFSSVLDLSSESGAVEVLSSHLLFYSGSTPYLAAFLNPRLELGAMVNFE